MCRYFLNGYCRYGDFCRNSHNIQNEPAPSEPEPEQPLEQSQENNAPFFTVTNNDDNNNNYNATSEVTRNWIDAPEFVPRSHNINQVTQPASEDEGASRYVYTNIVIYKN